MFKAILIPTDGSELSEQAVRHGVALAKSIGARVVGLHVTLPLSAVAFAPMMVADTLERYQSETERFSAQCLAVIESEAKHAGVPSFCLSRGGEHPYQEIIEVAREMHCDAICMASHGRRGVAALMLGSETSKVLVHSTIPVLVVR